MVSLLQMCMQKIFATDIIATALMGHCWNYTDSCMWGGAKKKKKSSWKKQSESEEEKHPDTQSHQHEEKLAQQPAQQHNT